MTTTASSRIASVDIVRGLIMVIMALDHTRDYFHVDTQFFQPTDLTRTTIPLFFTRWITHFCAPTFVLLSGVSIRLRLNKVPRPELKKYLLTRGFWLILLELTVFRFIMLFNFYYDITFLTVLWMIGFCMMIMAAIIYLNDRLILIISVLILTMHQLTDLIPVDNQSVWFFPWTVLMKSGFVPPAFMFTYPIVPWLGVMMLGYWVGRLYLHYPAEQRRKRLMITGVSMLAMFMIIRSINLYGDPVPWSVAEKPFFTFLGFLNVTKYPISLSFALLTIGPVMILLSVIDDAVARPQGFLNVIGREPLFYFLGHFLVIHIGAIALYMIREGKSFSDIDTHSSAGFAGLPAGSGVGLAGTYIAWALVVGVMYLFCRWYGHYKKTHNNFLTRWI